MLQEKIMSGDLYLVTVPSSAVDPWVWTDVFMSHSPNTLSL